MPSQSERSLLLNAAAAEGYMVEYWDIPGAYMNSLNDSRFRVTMRKLPMANGG